MIRIGNPTKSNQNIRQSVTKVNWMSSGSLNLKAVSLTKLGSKNCAVLDIGKSSREDSDGIASLASIYHTLDINEFGDYPDILADLCDPDLKDKLKFRYELIICNSILEHVYDPKTATDNLLNLLSDDGVIIGSVPFLFPRHCPDDLHYQDFYRFTPEALGYLFREADFVYACPTRGRLGTSLLMLSFSYKYLFEERFPRAALRINHLLNKGRHSFQTSTIEFCISKKKLANLHS